MQLGVYIEQYSLQDEIKFKVSSTIQKINSVDNWLIVYIVNVYYVYYVIHTYLNQIHTQDFWHL